jgi:hypothetical protein
MKGMTVSHHIVAKLAIEHVGLRSLLGGYELLIAVAGETTPVPVAVQRFAVEAARVEIAAGMGPTTEMGIARPDKPERGQQYPNAVPFRVELRLPLSPYQLAAIEDLRGQEDLRLQVTLVGHGGDDRQSFPINESFHKTVGRSDWVQQLKAAGAADILLLEIPMPFGNVPPDRALVIESLKQAQRVFLDGHYIDCIINCRKTIEALGVAEGRDRYWSSAALERLCKNREAMTLDDRTVAAQAALVHLASLAVHGSGIEFSREDARFALAQTASFVARSLRGTSLMNGDD